MMTATSPSSVQAQIQGDVQGQVAIGDYVIQIGSIHGGVVNIAPTGQAVQPQPRPRPVRLRPRRFPRFLDRDAPLQAIDEAAGANIPVAFYGESGIGKTVFLRHLAYYPPNVTLPDGLIYLSARDTPLGDLLLALYDALYERPPEVKPTATQIRQALSDVRALVLLDDVALARDDLGTLLDAAPRCTFVLTSEKRILWGEGQSVQLAGLPEEAALQLLQGELGRDFSAEERTSARALVSAMDGHPLRLLQAAAQVQEAGGKWEQVVQTEQAPDSAQALTAQTLRSLSDAQRQVLAFLAVSGDAPLPEEHLASLAQLSDLATVLEMLQKRNVVEAHSPRYTLTGNLSTLLRSAWDLTPWVGRALRHFVEWATEHREMPDRLFEVRDVIVEMLRWGMRLHRWPEVFNLARAIEGALALSAYWETWSRVLDWALQAAQHMGDKAAEAWARHQLGSQALCLGEKSLARQQLIRALRMRESLGDEIGASLTRHNLNLLLAPPAPPQEPPAEPLTGVEGGGLPLLAKVALGVGVVGLIGFGAWQLLQPAAPPVETPEPITATPTETPTPSSTFTPTSTPTSTPSPTPTFTETPSPTPTETPTPSVTPSPSNTPDVVGPAAPALFVPEPREELICSDNLQEIPVRLEWGTVNDPSGILEYQVAIESIERVPFAYPVERTRTPYLNAVLPCNEAFSWQVRAVDGAGNAGSWSQSSIFSTLYDTVGPPAPRLSAPSNGAELLCPAGGLLSLRWQPVSDPSDIAYYTVVMTRTLVYPELFRYFTSTYQTQGAVTEFTLENSCDMVYAWRVRAVDGVGNVGDWSETWSYSFVSPTLTPTLTPSLTPSPSVSPSPTVVPLSLGLSDPGELRALPLSIRESRKLSHGGD